MKLLLLVWTLHVSLVVAQECQERDIRITNTSVSKNGSTYSIAGGLQICVANQWGTVCQSQWSESDATVACHQLGLYYADKLCQDSCFGNIRTFPSHYGINCNGSENSLYECGRTRNSGCANAAGVYCALNMPSLIYCTTSEENVSSNSSDGTTESCPPNVCQDCRQSNKGTAATSKPWNGDKSGTLESSCSQNSAELALYISCALLSVALIIAFICLVGTCLKLRKNKKLRVIEETANLDHDNQGLNFSSSDIQNSTDNVPNISSNVCYGATGNLEVNEDNIQNISSNICYEITKVIQPGEDDIQSISSNICYGATDNIISKKNECYATLKEV